MCLFTFSGDKRCVWQYVKSGWIIIFCWTNRRRGLAGIFINLFDLKMHFYVEIKVKSICVITRRDSLVFLFWTVLPNFVSCGLICIFFVPEKILKVVIQDHWREISGGTVGCFLSCWPNCIAVWRGYFHAKQSAWLFCKCMFLLITRWFNMVKCAVYLKSEKKKKKKGTSKACNSINQSQFFILNCYRICATYCWKTMFIRIEIG